MILNLLILLAFLAAACAADNTKISWKSVAVDASGFLHVAVAAYNNDLKQGYSWYMSNDGGDHWTWIYNSPKLDWRNVYSDSTGQFLVGYAEYNPSASSETPPLYISHNRGATWQTGASTVNFPVTNEIAGNTTSLWTSVNSRLYTSPDFGNSWKMLTNIPSKEGSSSSIAVIGSSISVDSKGQNIYIICDGGLCISKDSGKSFTATYTDDLVKAVQADPTGQYVFILTDKYLNYSSDFGSTWKTLKDYTAPGIEVVSGNFLKVTGDHKYVFTFETAKSYPYWKSLVSYNVATSAQSTKIGTPEDITDVAVSSSGLSMIFSTVSGSLYSSSNSGATWWIHEPSAQTSRLVKT